MTDSHRPAAEVEQLVEDPVYRHSRREAILIFSVWVVALIWTIPFCYLNGYVWDFDPANVRMILGIPSWAFWGIVCPWLVGDVFTVWFCFFYMRDDDLEPETDPDSLTEPLGAAR